MGVVYEFLIKPILKGEPRQIPYRLGRKLNDLTRGQWDDRNRQDSGPGIWVYPEPLTSPVLRDIFYKYYGVYPRYVKMTEWTNTAGNKPQACFWHRDNEACKTMKVFTYLNDVGPDQGPHQYQVGSHMDHPKFYSAEHNFQDPATRVRTITGPKGTTFVEIPHGLHRSTMVRRGERRVRQIFYSYDWRPDTIRAAPLEPYHVDVLKFTLPG